MPLVHPVTTETEVELLLNILPPKLRDLIKGFSPELDFMEIVTDLGRELELRFYPNSVHRFNYKVTFNDLDYIENRLDSFNSSERVGVPNTLHRISRVPDKNGKTVGFTFRVGRHYTGMIELIEDLLELKQSILIIGVPGSGKSTLLRQICSFISAEQNSNVIVVDKTSEIGGESNPAHSAIGSARRFQVPNSRKQSETLLFALESHFPQTIIVDEISNSEEAMASRTISQRGVQLIATAHGKDLHGLLGNPPLFTLLGGVKTVTLSDEESKLRKTHKTVQERESEPVFQIVIELKSFDRVAIYHNSKEAIDAILAGGICRPEERQLKNGKVVTLSRGAVALPYTDLDPPSKRRTRK